MTDTSGAVLRAALGHIVRRLQMDVNDGSRPDQWSMEDLIRVARAALYTPPQAKQEASTEDARNAARYLWLREQIKTEPTRVLAQALFWNNGSRGELDKAIDLAMTKDRP